MIISTEIIFGNLSTIILFLLVLGVIVFFHELGHFLVAKFYGVKVDEFGLGFPPKIWGFKKGETEYTINWIPLGGFVKIVGEDGGDNKDPRSFSSKSIGKRFQIIAAGVVMNVILAFVIFSIIFMVGFPQDVTGEDLSKLTNARDVNIQITSVVKDSSADKIGLKPGDVILKVDEKDIATTDDLYNYAKENLDKKMVLNIARGKEVLNKEIIPQKDIKVQITSVLKDTPADKAGLKIGDVILKMDEKNITTLDDLHNYIKENLDKKIVLSIARGDETLIKEVAPRKDYPENQGSLGVGIAQTLDIAQTAIITYSPIDAVKKSFEYVIYISSLIISSFIGIIWGIFTTGKVVGDVSGPIGIAVVIQQAASMGLMTVLNFIALISINLAIINVLPFPALDGGRLLFLIIEKIKGSPLNQEWEAKANNVGFALLMLLMVVVTLKDLIRIDILGKISGLFG